MSLSSSSGSSSSNSSPVATFDEDSLDFVQGWPRPEDYLQTFSELKQYCAFDQDNSNDSWSVSLSNSSTISPPNEEAFESLSPPELSIHHSNVNYYPNFDPKEYFCDTVAVENASMVAQIVGKKGSKIKQLVTKYGIRIRTPTMEQEPVFIIHGKRANVYSVKQEIQSAAAHFMRLEQSKLHKLSFVMKNKNATAVKLFIPTRYVGLVIGRNGRIVRELQINHNVHVETPKFDIRQYFVIYGPDVAIESTLEAIKELLVKKSGICLTEVRPHSNEVHYIE